MAPVQNTFTIVPNAPPGINDRDGSAGSSNARMSRPPMTTKQVKKAYQKATRGPKLSKAEQRRQDLFEQDRIRKEFEKERNQARAKAARDRKKEKEEQARAERKKKGLPLVDVRASQDTIARFIRPKPSHQRDDSPVSNQNEGKGPSSSPAHDRSGKPDQIEQFEDVDKENIPPSQQKMATGGCHSDEELAAPDHSEPPNKKRKVEALKQDQVGEAPLPVPDVTGFRLSGSSAKQREPDISEDFLAIDFIEENILDDLFRDTDGVHGSLDTSEGKIDGKRRPQNSLGELPSSKPSELREQPSSLKDPIRPTALESPHLTGASTPNRFVAPTTTDMRKPQPIVPPSSRPFRHPKTPMAPPPVPPKFKTAKVSGPPPKAPQFAKPLLPTHANAGGQNRARATKLEQIQRDEQPPPSTQLFLLNHLDDFFPSPSQEVREIFEEPQMKTSSASKPQWAPSVRKASKPTPYISKVPTTQNNRTAAPAPKIKLKEKQRAQQPPTPIGPQKPIAQACLQPIQPVTQNVADAFDMPFFSTQDVLLSSQDIKDIEEEPLPQAKPPTPAPAPSKSPTKPRDKPRRPSKPLFTSSCSELRYKYALERNRTAAWEGPSARQKAREELDRLQALEDARLEALLANPGEENAEKNSQPAPIEGGDAVPGAAEKGSPLTLFATPPSPFSGPPTASWIELSCYNPLRQNNSDGRHLAPEAEKTAPNHKQRPPNTRPLRRENSGNSSGSGGGGGGQRNKPPKGYEAMLELLAKGPKQKPGAQSNKNNNSNNTVGNNSGTDNRKASGVGNGRHQTVQMTSNKHQAATATTGMTMTTNNNMKTTKPTTTTPTITIPASQETDYDGGEEWDDDDLLRDMP